MTLALRKKGEGGERSEPGEGLAVIDEELQVSRARMMRHQPTMSESLLWSKLRLAPFLAYRFRRQHRIGKYIADFASSRLKLIVEADGGQHSASTYDEMRDIYLASLGWKVLRFWNNEILDNVEGVLSVIEREVISRASQTLTRPPSADTLSLPSEGEG